MLSPVALNESINSKKRYSARSILKPEQETTTRKMNIHRSTVNFATGGYSRIADLSMLSNQIKSSIANKRVSLNKRRSTDIEYVRSRDSISKQPRFMEQLSRLDELVHEKKVQEYKDRFLQKLNNSKFTIWRFISKLRAAVRLTKEKRLARRQNIYGSLRDLEKLPVVKSFSRKDSIKVSGKNNLLPPSLAPQQPRRSSSTPFNMRKGLKFKMALSSQPRKSKQSGSSFLRGSINSRKSRLSVLTSKLFSRLPMEEKVIDKSEDLASEQFSDHNLELSSGFIKLKKKLRGKRIRKKLIKDRKNGSLFEDYFRKRLDNKILAGGKVRKVFMENDEHKVEVFQNEVISGKQKKAVLKSKK